MSTSHSRSVFPRSWSEIQGPPDAATSLQLIEASGGLVRAGAVAKRLGVPVEQVERFRLTGRLLAVPLKNGYGYPVCQFEGRGFLSGFSTTLRALKGADSWQYILFFLTPSSQFGGRRPLDALRDGNQSEVLCAIQGVHPIDTMEID